MDVYKPVYPGLYYFDTFTFTTLGTSGHRGPDSTRTYTNAPWRDGDFSIVEGQQQWTVPATGTYQITAAGAYGSTPGRVVSGEVDLNEGQVVSLLVGQMPTPLTANVVDATTVGGGGGTFVVSGGTLLMVASGGDGTGGSAASFSPYGTGNGKNGGGYLSNGLATNATFKFLTPAAYINGGFGNIFPTGVVPEEGGFGGGQSPVTTGISGGGGYTGSPGDGVSGATCYGVGTITDLGATSNSAGYINVSLVNPAPINQTYDLKTTTLVSDVQVYGSFYWKHILYSPELDVFVLIGTYRYGFDIITTILYSIDGKLWYTGLLQSRTSYSCKWVTWAPELGVFLACGDVFPWFSSDGIIWTQDLNGETTESFTTVTWIPFLRKFIAVNESFNMLSSSDGKSWSVIQNSPPIPRYALKKSMISSSDVVVTCIYVNVYSSRNGTDWDLTLTTSSPVTSWAYGNGHFFVTTAENYSYYYSTDGYTWQNGTFPIPPSTYWPPAGTTVFLANSVMVTFPENSYISTDYVNWTLYPNNLAAPPESGMFSGTEYVDSVYNSKKGYVVALAERDIHLTIDGAVWIKAERTFIPANTNASLSYTGYAYSETSDVIVLTRNQAYAPKGIYYKNGAWKQITGLDFYPQICVWNPINGLFELSDTVLFDPVREVIVSGGKSSDWLIPSLFQTFYKQGLNNNLPKNKAFSISGVVFENTVPGYDYLPVSCDGTTFITMTGDPISTSTDGVTWTPRGGSVTNVGDYLYFGLSVIKYVSKYKLFVAFGYIAFIYNDQQTGGIFTSKDGIEWFRIYSDEYGNVVQINDVLWNENDDTFIIFYLGRNPTYLKLFPQVS